MLKVNDLVRLQGEGPKMMISKIYDDGTCECYRYEGDEVITFRLPVDELKPVYATRLRPETDRKPGDIIAADPMPLVTPSFTGFSPEPSDFSSPDETPSSDFSGGGGDFSGGGASDNY